MCLGTLGPVHLSLVEIVEGDIVAFESLQSQGSVNQPPVSWRGTIPVVQHII